MAEIQQLYFQMVHLYEAVEQLREEYRQLLLIKAQVGKSANPQERQQLDDAVASIEERLKSVRESIWQLQHRVGYVQLFKDQGPMFDI
jgi:hypothetical protein